MEFECKAGNTPTIFNEVMTVINTEYDITIPAETVRLTVQQRGAHTVRIAFVTGKVAGSTAPFYTLKSGDVLEISDVTCFSEVLYLASPDVGSIVEVITWSVK